MVTKDTQRGLLEKLTGGILELTRSDRWQHHLDVQSRFHRYSFGNVVLIAAQAPGATRVAGFHTWKGLGRTVARGEKAIGILAPLVTRESPECEGEPQSDPVIRGFKYVPVFDITQTEGEELPSIAEKLSGGDPANCFERLSITAAAIGYSVVTGALASGVNGDCNFSARRIRVEAGNTPAQQVKTLAHEIAHALLHEGGHDRPLAELEAESTAYVICQRLGIDAGSYSFGYVAAWAGGGDEAISAIRASGGRIQHAASTILGELEAGIDFRTAA